MKLEPKNLENMIKASLNLIENDLVITNCKVINVFTGEILPADVYIYDGFISHVEYECVGDLTAVKEVYDGNGKFLSPGFIDAHVHIESSLLTPGNYAEAVVPLGTTTVITDPHEIANVFGKQGVKYMIEASAELPMRQLIDLPSCVPSVSELEHSGASFYYDDIEEMLQWDRVIGIAEVMDYEGVINSESRIHDILAVAKKHQVYMQGHAPQVSGRELSAYLCAGPSTCHESRSAGEALEKYRNGMKVDIRDSNSNANVMRIVPGMNKLKYRDNLCFCTDDRKCNVLLKDGHMNGVIRDAISAGMDPVDAIRCATYNIAKEIKLEKLGAIAPGYVADMVLIDDLINIKPLVVFFDGRLVSENGKLTEPICLKDFELEKVNSINIRKMSASDFQLKVDKHQFSDVSLNLIEYESYESSVTHCVSEAFKVKDGYVLLDTKKDTMYAAVINRYSLETKSIAVIRRFGISEGAIASSVSHDSHNVTVVYDNADNAVIAVNSLIEYGGGMVAVKDGAVICSLDLPVAGLMSTLKAKEVAPLVTKMAEANRLLGNHYLENPISRITILSLIVSPDIKLSDMGMVDIKTKKIIPVFS
jgi:adenine deaminase